MKSVKMPRHTAPTIACPTLMTSPVFSARYFFARSSALVASFAVETCSCFSSGSRRHTSSLTWRNRTLSLMWTSYPPSSRFWMMSAGGGGSSSRSGRALAPGGGLAPFVGGAALGAAEPSGAGLADAAPSGAGSAPLPDHSLSFRSTSGSHSSSMYFSRAGMSAWICFPSLTMLGMISAKNPARPPSATTYVMRIATNRGTPRFSIQSTTGVRMNATISARMNGKRTSFDAMITAVARIPVMPTKIRRWRLRRAGSTPDGGAPADGGGGAPPSA